MPYLIDGHNLIGKLPDLSLRDIDDEIQLITLLQDFCHRQQKSVEVYFDNAPPGSSRVNHYGAVKAVFVRSGKTADQAIVQRLKALRQAARNWTVVSSDHQVQKAAHASQAKVLSAEEFAQTLFASPHPANPTEEKPDRLLQESEIEDWLKLFQHRKNN